MTVKAAGFGAQLWESEAWRPADFQGLPHVQDIRINGYQSPAYDGRLGTAAPGIVDSVLKNGAARVTRINETTREQLRKLVADAIDKGMSPREAAMHIQAATAFSEYRSERIARTELMLAYNESALSAYGTYGVTEVVAIDGDKDAECEARNGKVFSVSDAFGIADHPNGTLDWAPVASSIKQAAPAQKVPKERAEPKVTHPKYDQDAQLKQLMQDQEQARAFAEQQAILKQAKEAAELAAKQAAEAAAKQAKWAQIKKEAAEAQAKVDAQAALQAAKTPTGKVKWDIKSQSYVDDAGKSWYKQADPTGDWTGNYTDDIAQKVASKPTAPKTPKPTGDGPAPGTPIKYDSATGTYVDGVLGQPIKWNDSTFKWEWVKAPAKPKPSTLAKQALPDQQDISLYPDLQGYYLENKTKQQVVWNASENRYEYLLKQTTGKVKQAAAGQAKTTAQLNKSMGKPRTFSSISDMDQHLRKWAGDIGTQWSKGARLTQAQWKIAKDYTGSYYSTLNGYLRGIRNLFNPRDIARYQDEARTLSALMQPLDDTYTVLRGVDDGAFLNGVNRGKDLADVLKAGNAFTDQAFMSTSINLNHSWNGAVKMIIRVPKGTRAMYVQPISSHTSEWELLLDKGQTFVIDSVTKTGYSSWTIEVHIV